MKKRRPVGNSKKMQKKFASTAIKTSKASIATGQRGGKWGI